MATSGHTTPATGVSLDQPFESADDDFRAAVARWQEAPLSGSSLYPAESVGTATEKRTLVGDALRAVRHRGGHVQIIAAAGWGHLRALTVSHRIMPQ